jgi:hypothetical protein
MQTIYIGNTLINDVFLGSQRMDDITQTITTSVRSDAFGSFVKLAQPGTKFTTLGMSNFYSDISSLISVTGSNLTITPAGAGSGLGTPYLYPSSSTVVSSSYYFYNNGYQTSVFVSGSQNVGTATTTELNFGTSSFVIEAWVNRKSARTGPPFNMFMFGETSGDYMLIDWNGTDIRFLTNGSNSPVTTTLTENQWNHLAFVRSGNKKYVYVNGIQGINSTWTTASIINPPSGFWNLQGVNDGSTSNGIAKQIQDYRITIGSDRNYTGSIIPVPQSIVTYS